MSLPEQIRACAAAGDFAGAAHYFAEHARHIRAAIDNRTCQASVMEEAGALLEGVRKLAIARRSHLERRLQQARSRAYLDGVYGQTGPRRVRQP